MTNREYLRTLMLEGSVTRTLDTPLRGLIEMFDAVWYGHQPIGQRGYAEARTAAANVEIALRGRAA